MLWTIEIEAMHSLFYTGTMCPHYYVRYDMRLKNECKVCSVSLKLLQTRSSTAEDGVRGLYPSFSFFSFFFVLSFVTNPSQLLPHLPLNHSFPHLLLRHKQPPHFSPPFMKKKIFNVCFRLGIHQQGWDTIIRTAHSYIQTPNTKTQLAINNLVSLPTIVAKVLASCWKFAAVALWCGL